MMKRLMMIGVAMGCMLLPLTGTAQRGRGGPGLGGGGPAFNTTDATTEQGKITEIYTTAAKNSTGMGYHFRLQTETETLIVHVGPQWFVQEQSLTLKTGDEVKVAGWRTLVDGAPSITAREITRGDETMTIRDSRGLPLFRRSARR